MLFAHYLFTINLRKKNRTERLKSNSWTEILLVEQNSSLCQSLDVIFHLVSQIANRNV